MVGKSPSCRNRPKMGKQHPRRAPLKGQTDVQSERIKSAIRNAKKMLRAFKKGDAEKVTEATLMQGILSGDVTAAAIAVKIKLQNENLALRRALALSRLRTEGLTQRIQRRQAELMEKPALTSTEQQQLMARRIQEVYGVALPAASTITEAEVVEAKEIASAQPTSPAEAAPPTPDESRK